MPTFCSPFDLTGRDIWVIGGAGHLGEAVVSLLAAMGSRVLCADLDDRAQQTVSVTVAFWRRDSCTLDVRDETAMHNPSSANMPHSARNTTRFGQSHLWLNLKGASMI